MQLRWKYKKKSRHRADPKNQSVLRNLLLYLRIRILQVALHRITVTVGRLLTAQPDCKTAGLCNLRQIILSSVIIYACHIKQSTDNHCASTMYFVRSEYSIEFPPCQALICQIDTKCILFRIFCGVLTTENLKFDMYGDNITYVYAITIRSCCVEEYVH